MSAQELVLRDLVDTLLQENLFGVADALTVNAAPGVPGAELADGEQWCHIPCAGGPLAFRGRDGGALQRHRLSRGPVWLGGTEVRSPDEVLAVLADSKDNARAEDVAADLRAAVEHAAVTLSGWSKLADGPVWKDGLLTGERVAATRNRPFHPTARAAVGWSAAELERLGPMREAALGMDWVAVRRERTRLGSGAGSDGIDRLVLDTADRERLAAAMAEAGIDDAEYQPLPVHPWQYAHVLRTEFAAEFAAGDVIPVARDIGGFHPTSSLRTLITQRRPQLHLKLPLGVATLGAARLLPPRYLDNAERAQRTMAGLCEHDPELAGRVALCDERAWCGWQGDDDEFADRPGQLTAQVRSYPAEPDDALVVPMAAFAAHEWDLLWQGLTEAGFDPADPVGFFRLLAGEFCALTLSFLRHGVLPELHGQNVVVVLRRGQLRRFVLRDHDTLRLYPEWMRAAGVDDPGYRIKPGARQSLRLDSGQALLGYAQTLGFQVNLYGIADALGRHHGIEESVWWRVLADAVVDCLDRLELPGHVADVVEYELLRSPDWPSRQVLGPLLAAGRSAGVSMPASAGRVPNPLPARAAVRS